MKWSHLDPSDCPSPRMVANLTLTGGGNYEPTGTQHAECPGHCDHVWVETQSLDWLQCRDCGEVAMVYGAGARGLP
jgi:hypothetical protein